MSAGLPGSGPCGSHESSSAADASAETAALRRTAERFRLHLEKSLELFVEATREGEILYVSPNVLTVLGYAESELIRESLFARVHPEDVGHTRRLFALPEGRGICRYRHKDGSWRWLDAAGREFVDPQGRTLSALVVRDITERRKAEASRRKLESELFRSAKLSAFGLLVGGIAHDFNNMLTVISCHLCMARTNGIPPDVASALSEADQAVGRAKHMVRQIMNFSRSRSEEFQPVRLSSVIREVLQFLQPTWPPGVEIVTDLAAGDASVMGSAVQLHQVLMNLLVNAAHAMEAGPGRLEVRLGAADAGTVYSPFNVTSPARSLVELVIRDTGHGMDEATQRRIFEPFFSTKRAGRGTGLGLVVVHRILGEHGATIRVSSAPGQGTTFRIHFPALPEPAGADHPSAALVHSGNPP